MAVKGALLLIAFGLAVAVLAMPKEDNKDSRFWGWAYTPAIPIAAPAPAPAPAPASNTTAAAGPTIQFVPLGSLLFG